MTDQSPALDTPFVGDNEAHWTRPSVVLMPNSKTCGLSKVAEGLTRYDTVAEKLKARSLSSLMNSFDCDAWVLPYVVHDAAGKVRPEQYRLVAEALGQLRSQGWSVSCRYAFIDVDLKHLLPLPEGKAPKDWKPGWSDVPDGFLNDTVTKIAQMHWCYFYTTEHGFRVVFHLSLPVPAGPGYRALLENLHEQFKEAGVPADTACKDWQRGYRLPRITKASGVRTWEEPWFWERHVDDVLEVDAGYQRVFDEPATAAVRMQQVGMSDEEAVELLNDEVALKVKRNIVARKEHAWIFGDAVMATEKRNPALTSLCGFLCLAVREAGGDDPDVAYALAWAAAKKMPQEGHDFRSEAAGMVSRFWFQDEGKAAAKPAALPAAVPAEGTAERVLLPANLPPEQVDSRPRLRSIDASILSQACADPIVKGLLYKGELAIAYGEPGDGKTLTVLDLLLAMATGAHTWADHKMKETGPVAYVAAEGKRGIVNRITAWLTHRKEGIVDGFNKLRDRLFLYEGGTQFSDEVGWAWFKLEVERVRPTLVVFDTLHACMAGLDENSAADVAIVVSRVNEIRTSTGCAVMLVHHTGKDGQRERGSSALRGAADVMFKVVKNDSLVWLYFDKMKEANLPPEIQFQLHGPILIGLDGDGDPVHSACVEYQTTKSKVRFADMAALKALAKLDPDESVTLTAWMADLGMKNRSTLQNIAKRLEKLHMISKWTEGKASRYAINCIGRDELVKLSKQEE